MNVAGATAGHNVRRPVAECLGAVAGRRDRCVGEIQRRDVLQHQHAVGGIVHLAAQIGGGNQARDIIGKVCWRFRLRVRPAS